MRKRLETGIFWLLCAIFFVPLLVPYHSYIFPFIVPKIIWLRSFMILMVVGYALLLAVNYQRYRVRLTPVTGAVLAYLGSLVISTFVGVDWYRSFWDGHERMLGLFTLIHFVGFYLVLAHVGFDRARWQWIMRWFMVGASVVMLVGVAQKINPQVLLNNGSDRVAGTLGNAIYLGGYGLFLIWLSGLAWMREKDQEWKILAIVTGLLGVSGLLFSGTRGTLLGMVAGLVVAAGTLAVTAKAGSALRRWVAVGAGAAVVAVVALFMFRTTTVVRNIPAVGSLLNTSIVEGTAGTRLMSWQIAVESWRERPVFGWGINNFFYAFNQYYRPEFLEHGWGETWFDNAHNIVMNTLAAQGAVGVVTYLGIFGAAGWALVVAYRAGRTEQSFLVFGLGFLSAHLVQAAFVFENPTSYLYFFFTLALINQHTHAAAPLGKGEKAPVDRVLSVPLLVVAGVVAALVIYTTNVRVSNANQLTLKALQSLYNNPTVAVSYYNQALAAGSPHIDDIRADFARVVDQLIGQYINAKRTDLALQIFTPAYQGLQKNIAMHPYDIRNHINTAQLAVTGAKLENKPGYLLEAQAILEDALKKSPRRQQIQYLLAGLYSQIGQREQAVQVLLDAWNANKKIEGNWWRLGMAYYDNGQVKEAKALFAEFDKTGIKPSAEAVQVRTLVDEAK